MPQKVAKILGGLSFAMNGVGGIQKSAKLDDRRNLSSPRGQKRTARFRAKTERADAGNIIGCQHIIEALIRLSVEDVFSTARWIRALPIRPAVRHRPEKRRGMMRTRTQRKRCGINGKSAGTAKPFAPIFKQDRRAAFRGMKAPGQMGLAFPLNVDFNAHGRARRMRFGTRRSSKLSASASVAGAARGDHAIEE